MREECTDVRKYCFSNGVVDSRNEVSEEEVIATTIGKFKKLYKKKEKKKLGYETGTRE